MKNFLYIYVLVSFLVLFSACGSKEERAVFILDKDNEQVVVENKYKKEQLEKQTVKTIFSYEKMGITKDQAEKFFDGLGEGYDLIKGVTYTLSYEEEQAVETVEIDFAEVNDSSLKTLALISLPDRSDGIFSEAANEKKLLGLGFVKQQND